MIGSFRRISGASERSLAREASNRCGVVLGFRGGAAGQAGRVHHRNWSSFLIYIDETRVGNLWFPHSKPRFVPLNRGAHRLQVFESTPKKGAQLLSADFDVADGPTIAAIWPAEDRLFVVREARAKFYSLAQET